MIRSYKKIPIGKFKGRSGYCVVSHTTGKVLSCYLSKAGAQKAIERYRRFRNIKPAKAKGRIKRLVRKSLKLRK